MAKDNQKKKTCFIITPIGNVNSNTRRKIDGLIEQVIKPAIGDKYRILVSHKSLDSGSMTKYIVQSIYNSDLVIANLTDQNPNVMYEVAFRHACAKPIIHIAEDISQLPFDISDHRTIEYVDDIHGVGDLKKKLIDMVNEIEKGEGVISNPIIDNLDVTNIIAEPEVKDINIVEAINLLSDKVDRLENKLINKENKDKAYYNEFAKRHMANLYNLPIGQNHSDFENGIIMRNNAADANLYTIKVSDSK